jgi:hypothetical protein
MVNILDEEAAARPEANIPKKRAATSRAPRATSADVSNGEAKTGKPRSDSSMGTDRSLERSTEIDRIPDFAREAWTTDFLPMIYNKLFLSRKPFEDFRKGHQVIQYIQDTVDIVYPTSGHHVKWSDEICQTVSNNFFLLAADV